MNTRKDQKQTSIRIPPLFVLGALTLIVWWFVIQSNPRVNAEFDMLDVGQGDSSLLRFPNGILVLTDAGPPNGQAVHALERILGNKKYIDIGIISHPQLDHFGGYLELLDQYQFGLIAVNGREEDILEWHNLRKKITDEHIPLLILGVRDKIHIGSDRIDILSPDESWIGSGELNDTGIIERATIASSSVLLTADISANVEEYLVGKYNLQSDILKVPHHGSKYSSSEPFLERVNPKIAMIGVGAKNNYGHPTKETLARLQGVVGQGIFRTDQNGTIRVHISSGTLQIFVEKGGVR